ncbi:hypothetical protein FACS1894206_00620 [Deltaproteobacteria bacterium]|nr:hypothetical protein FACS1894206_00620 [Deltaproteobacteria bacterium]
MSKKNVFPLSAAFAACLLLICGSLVLPAKAWEVARTAEKSGVLATSVGYSAAALAPEADVTIAARVTLKAPEMLPAPERLPVSVALVIDHSGSMGDAKKMDYAKRAAKTLIRSLAPEDMLAIVIYDDTVKALFPLQKVSDKDKLIKLVEAVEPGGRTFLSGGLEAGIKQLAGVRREGPCRVILLSDGLANVGVTRPDAVAAIGAKARKSGIGVSSIGLGLDFHEDMMQRLAQSGGGQYYYIEDSEYLPSVFKQELALTVESFTRNLRCAFISSGAARGVKVYGYESVSKDNTTDIDISDLSAGEERQIMLRLTVKPEKMSGLQKIGNLQLSYTDRQSGEERQISLPMQLEVLAEEPARREAEERNAAALKAVREEVALLDADEAQVEAMGELHKGNKEKAKAILQKQQESLALAAPGNKTVAGKMEQLKEVEANLEQASQDAALRNQMTKASKSTAYMSAKGQKQGIMLRKGDTGYMVEKLQNTLQKNGAYAGKADGVYSAEVEDAVKSFQKSQSMDADGVAGPATMKALGL